MLSADAFEMLNTCMWFREYCANETGENDEGTAWIVFAAQKGTNTEKLLLLMLSKKMCQIKNIRISSISRPSCVFEWRLKTTRVFEISVIFYL